MEPQRFRFVVSSAEEAVTILRDRIGGAARVVSVRQVEGTGLARFLQTPKLEVIAEIAEEEIAPTVQAAAVATAAEEFFTVEKVVEKPRNNSTPGSAPAAPSNSAALVAEEPAPTVVGLARLLRAGGIPAQVIARMQNQPGWDALQKMPAGRALIHVGMQLREQCNAIPRQRIGDHIAFIGSPGSGKTTALCKWLATDVFVRQRRGVVLKLDLDRANPGDALAVFCEALGVHCARSAPDVPTLAPDQSLYIDVPGVLPNREGDAEQLNTALGPLFTTSRVMVINAAYEAALIKSAYEFAERVGCTHVVFTHLDELTHWGKLWEFLLGQKLTPLFLSTGSNIAGDIEENVFDAVLARTFPDAGVQAARSASAS